ncbi:MAG: formylglycine-generating enzyme family protein [Saprospiraceae bacterium]|nr:formylglycine-generating enzyme family protein [Saprospiraceae bacterium]
MSQRSEIPLLLPHLDLVFIQGGDFLMGDEHGDLSSACRPVHKVTVKDFYLCKYPVTQALWRAVMGEDPPELAFKGSGNRPVERVSWDDTQLFIQQLNELTGYRLPTEAEWEYAARGGIYGQGFKYAGSNKLKEVGWYDENSHDETKPVGLKFPNELSLYDMSGNVWEWCQDVWHENYDGAPDDGSVWMEGGDQNLRVVRGGSWDYNTDYCRVARRGGSYLDIRTSLFGFRLARS